MRARMSGHFSSGYKATITGLPKLGRRPTTSSLPSGTRRWLQRPQPPLSRSTRPVCLLRAVSAASVLVVRCPSGLPGAAGRPLAPPLPRCPHLPWGPAVLASVASVARVTSSSTSSELVALARPVPASVVAWSVLCRLGFILPRCLSRDAASTQRRNYTCEQCARGADAFRFFLY